MKIPKLIKKKGKRYIEHKGKRYVLVSDKTDREIIKDLLGILKQIGLAEKRKRLKKRIRRRTTNKGKTNAPNPESSGTSSLALKVAQLSQPTIHDYAQKLLKEKEMSNRLIEYNIDDKGATKGATKGANIPLPNKGSILITHHNGKQEVLNEHEALAIMGDAKKKKILEKELGEKRKELDMMEENLNLHQHSLEKQGKDKEEVEKKLQKKKLKYENLKNETTKIEKRLSKFKDKIIIQKAEITSNRVKDFYNLVTKNEIKKLLDSYGVDYNHNDDKKTLVTLVDEYNGHADVTKLMILAERDEKKR